MYYDDDYDDSFDDFTKYQFNDGEALNEDSSDKASATPAEQLATRTPTSTQSDQQKQGVQLGATQPPKQNTSAIETPAQPAPTRSPPAPSRSPPLRVKITSVAPQQTTVSQQETKVADEQPQANQSAPLDIKISKGRGAPHSKAAYQHKDHWQKDRAARKRNQMFWS